MPTSDIADTQEWNPGQPNKALTSREYSVATRIDSELEFTPPDSEFELSDESIANERLHRDSHLGKVVRMAVGETETIYKLTSLIGIGGMGKVYEAIPVSADDSNADSPKPELPEDSLSNVLAIKLAKRSRNFQKSQLRLQRESNTLSQVTHRNIVKYRGEGLLDGQNLFVAMDRINGQNIADFVEKKGLSVAQRVALFIKVCDAVDYCHQHGIVHRDIKPANILVDAESLEPILIDFGIAKTIDSQESVISEIQSDGKSATDGQLVGTIQYMSPEQALQKQNLVDQRSDVYSLGVLLFELLTGRPLISGEDLDQNSLESLVSTITAGRRSMNLEDIEKLTELESDSELIRGLDIILDRAISYDIDLRYSSVHAFKSDLASLLRAPQRFVALHRPTVKLDIKHRTSNPIQTAASWSRNHIWQSISLCLLLSLAFAFGAASSFDCQSADKGSEDHDGNQWLPMQSLLCNSIKSETPSDCFQEFSNVQDFAVESDCDSKSYRFVELKSGSKPAIKGQLVFTIDDQIREKLTTVPTDCPKRKKRILIRPNTKLHWMTQCTPEYTVAKWKDLPESAQKQAIIQLENAVTHLEHEESLIEVKSLIHRIPGNTLYECFLERHPDASHVIDVRQF